MIYYTINPSQRINPRPTFCGKSIPNGSSGSKLLLYQILSVLKDLKKFRFLRIDVGQLPFLEKSVPSHKLGPQLPLY